ncbi:Rrf2 family transcriptional regulator [Opitutia bacterium ISCC 51]|nr:Rrf2 family transcriptional regulator [Opitutales bacterium]MDG2168241.1 Rrf2 family transcriptional regulator [Opitutales bacterium]QXD26408.1 Rrf2 family transcriptional regulator [Opitutae bacterium ISCC 51]QXD30474.1 Rrf2 family transcriptional regulator [Opitutae bacterium ISCC 52]
MKLSLKVEYACRVLAQLSRTYGNQKFSHIDELAKSEEIPANYLVQILNELRNGGLINSRRGKQGGYSLAKPPSEVTLYEIVTAIDGELLGINLGDTGYSGGRVQQVWLEVVESLKEKTLGYSLESFLPEESEDMYYI